MSYFKLETKEASHEQMAMLFLLSLMILGILRNSLSLTSGVKQQRTFEVDYDNNVFLKDGKPFRYISGSVDYFHIPRAYWQDRLRKMRAAGLNAICTYIEWKSHEPIRGQYDFSGENDFEHFIKLAQDEGLLVVLRPGPYIDAERDFGGYPPWLLYENPEMRLRTNDSSHTKFVYSWLTQLLPRIQPLLYGNGGPVIMVQVENEYGSYITCDRSYILWLRDVFYQYIEDKAVLFTTEANNIENLKCGSIPGVFATTDFELTNNITKGFEPLMKYQPHGPLVNSELYSGWFTSWGQKEDEFMTPEQIINTTRLLMNANASFNYLMFHGGTNFGFNSGMNKPPLLYVTTSFDFYAALSESGKLTEKYYAIRKVLSEFEQLPDINFNISCPAYYGPVILEPKVYLFDSDLGIPYGTFAQPRTFESLQLYTGFMLYETSLDSSTTDNRVLDIDHVHDRASVFVDGKISVVLSRSEPERASSLLLPKSGKLLSILVENMGHMCEYNMTDLKGLGKVTLNKVSLGPWMHTGYPMTNVKAIPDLPAVPEVKLPAFYSGSFQLPNPGEPPKDTFVDMTGWGKGVLYVNDHNLGRYWPTAGPQVTLYLPAPFLRQNNTFVILELERENPDRTINLVDQPNLEGPVSNDNSGSDELRISYFLHLIVVVFMFISLR